MHDGGWGGVSHRGLREFDICLGFFLYSFKKKYFYQEGIASLIIFCSVGKINNFIYNLMNFFSVLLYNSLCLILVKLEESR